MTYVWPALFTLIAFFPAYFLRDFPAPMGLALGVIVTLAWHHGRGSHG